MELKNYDVYFFFAVLIGISCLVFFILQPFIIPFIIAVILTHLFNPTYEAFLRVTGKRKGISSALTCLCVALVILIPVIFVFILVINEAQGMLVYFSKDNLTGKALADNMKSVLLHVPILNNFNLDGFINENLIINAAKSVSQNALTIFQGAYQGFAHLIFVIFIMFFSLFYLFIEGGNLIKKIMNLTPLKNNYEDVLIDKFNSISRATLKGTSLIAIIQGTLGGLLFWATGVSSPAFFGILMTVTSVIPSVGSGLIWLPVGIIMIILGKVNAGIIILLAGGLIISSIDNFIKPRLVGRDTQLHPLLVLFSTLGGISLFGIVGFIVGPIIMSLFVALWEIYSLEFKHQLKKFNQ
jgi:predicted PurR-regulated permease PerM